MATRIGWAIGLCLGLLACGDDAPDTESAVGSRSRPAESESAVGSRSRPAESESESASASESESASGSGSETAHRTRVLVVGSGTPVPDPDRSGPCVAVVVDGRPLLFDAGPGVVRAATAAGLDPVRVERVFLTHLHSDHTLGLPDLMLAPWVVGRDQPLVVRGPPGTGAMVQHLTHAWSADRRIRTNGLEHKGPLRVDAGDVEPGLVHEAHSVRVSAFAVAHGSWEHAFGYVVEGPDRRIVISGDTGPTDAIVRACDGCDVLIHEVYSASRYARLPPSAQRYHGSFHTSSHDVGRLASRARAKAVVLVHHLLWGASPESVVAEVREHYEGPVVFGTDGMVY